MKTVIDTLVRILCTYQIQLLFAAHLFAYPTFRKRPHFALRVILSALPLLIGFDLLLPLLSHGIRQVLFLIPFCWCFGTLLLCYECTPREALFSSSSALPLQNAVFNLFWITKSLFGFQEYSWISVLIYSGLIVLLYGMVYFQFRKYMFNREGHTLPQWPVIRNALILLIITVFLNRRVDGASWSVFIYFTYIAADALAIMMQYGLLHETDLKTRNEIIGQLLASEQKKQSITKENIELINRKCHDLKHQIEGLKRLDSDDERNAYIGEIEDAVLFYESAVKTGNETLDLILMEKQLYCKAHGITFTCICDGAQLSMMDTMDIYSLFGNAIDNAIEGILDENEKNRVIGLRVGRRGAFLTIHIENYLGHPLKIVDGLPVTSKDTDYHGFGVLSIRHVVKKYKGTMSIRTDQNLFRLDILIPCQK